MLLTGEYEGKYMHFAFGGKFWVQCYGCDTINDLDIYKPSKEVMEAKKSQRKTTVVKRDAAEMMRVGDPSDAANGLFKMRSPRPYIPRRRRNLYIGRS